jgi:hypothetical protein
MILEEPMLGSRLWLTVLVGAVVLTGQTSPAAAAPVVFDFEDGLQGWELHGAATRVQTQLLGGEWAIFGDGLVEGEASISMEMDLTDIASISVEQFFVDGDEDGLLFLQGIDLIENIFIGTLSRLEVIKPGNPSLRAVDVSTSTGVRKVGFVWGFVSESVTLPPIVGFIDNITFHPIPEPTTLVLLGIGLVGLAVLRRR